MKVRDYSDTAGPGARKVDRLGGPQKRIDLMPASGHSRCGAPTMTLRYAQPSPKAPAPSRETARFQLQLCGAKQVILVCTEPTKVTPACKGSMRLSCDLAEQTLMTLPTTPTVDAS